MDRTAETLADYAFGLRYADLTPAAIHAAKRSVIDSIGCAFGAFHAEPVKAMRTLAEVAKTLKCKECGTMNLATEWYCESCGAELAAL